MERTEQKKNAFSAPNTKKHRRQIKVDREGDVIMTDKVQERFKDRKTRGGRPDGLSKEERQKRYDKKACLRCGEVGHFRRDCPKNDTGRQGAVRIGMVRQSTPYPRTVQLLDDDVSDTDLYDEARMLGNEAYELVPQAKEVPDVISRDETTPVDRSVTSTEVRQRLAEHRCWVCGSQEHMAEDCRQKGRIAITGPKAEETAYQAILEQPYFEDPEVQDDEPVTPSVSEWKTEEHQAAHWTECELRCRFHKGQRRTVGWRMNDEWHETLLDKECRVEACPMHKKPEPSTQWGNWDNLPPLVEQHEDLYWLDCEDRCDYHLAQKERSRRQEDDCCHPNLRDRECLVEACRLHKALRTGPVRHELVHWTFCHNDNCPIHQDAKSNVGYFPKKRSGKRGQSKN
ncbi:hypothetical protein P3342_001714 [Pyrenophora teres f. teres]|nr:hypothetical protein P3342_001714 [Pyrenophora teres f. teres]